MMKLSAIFVLLLLAFPSTDIFAQNDAIISKIKENYLKIILPSSSESDSLIDEIGSIEKEDEIADQMVQELFNRLPPENSKIRQIISLQNEDGSFKDIDYADRTRSGWKPKQHAERILEMCKAFHYPQSSFYKSKEIDRRIHLGIGFWHNRKPSSLNWWQNEIGIPKTMGQVYLVMENELSNEEKEGAHYVMSQAKFGMTGQNKVWLASNVMIRGLLEKDYKIIRQARDIIASEIHLGEEEGIQRDWSFHQHGPQQQFGNYGLSFISSMSTFFKLFNGTDLAFDKEKSDILKNLINNGYRWIIWKKTMDMSALGRQFFHNADIHKAYMTLLSMQEMGMNYKDPKFYPLIGHKHFECSDYAIHREQGWMASLKMCSSRVQGSEQVNEDNLLGYYMGDGVTFYYIDGHEYMDALPVWDWRRIPGTTCYQSNSKMPVSHSHRITNPTSRVAGISEDGMGLASMEYIRDKVYVKKAWIFTHDMVISLGSSLTADSTLSVMTTVDQRLKKTDLEILTQNGWETANEMPKAASRAFHDRIGYISLDDNIMTCESSKKSGRWGDVMGLYKPKNISNNIVCIGIDHGVRPRNSHYAYAVIPETTKNAVSNFKTDNIDIIENDANAQIVTGKAMSGYLWAVIYKPVTKKIKGALLIAEKTGLYCFKKEKKVWKATQIKEFQQ